MRSASSALILKYGGFSWPLIVGALLYAAFVSKGQVFFGDGDTYWHIAAGRWIIEHRAVPAVDVFSHTMAGAPWTAHEWLSEVLMAAAYDAGGWTAVAALTAFAFACAVAALTRFALGKLAPVYALMFAAMAVLMPVTHLQARPHILVAPVMVVWTAYLVRSSEESRPPSLWLLPVMTLWANLHGSFTLGLALTLVFGFEAVMAALKNKAAWQAIRSWGVFFCLAVASTLLTPHGVEGLLFTAKIFESTYALDVITEWKSPNFHYVQPLELWLLLGLAVALHQGIRLPLVRIGLLLVLIHLALKHARYMELIGFLAPLFLAAPLSHYWKKSKSGEGRMARVNALFDGLAQRARWPTVAVTSGALFAYSLAVATFNPASPKDNATPYKAVQAAQAAGMNGPVFNAYAWGGYLIYSGIPPFIDGRADVYGDEFLKTYLDALSLKTTHGLEALLEQHRVEWTLLSAESAAVALLDHLPEWERLYADKQAVVHVKRRASAGAG